MAERITANLSEWRIGTRDYGEGFLRHTVFARGELIPEDQFIVQGRAPVRAMMIDGTFVVPNGVAELWTHDAERLELKLLSDPQKQDLVRRHEQGLVMPNWAVLLIDGLVRTPEGVVWPYPDQGNIVVRMLTLEHVTA